ncbi:MAG: amidohydrolase [Nibricoccus sp.]
MNSLRIGRFAALVLSAAAVSGAEENPVSAERAYVNGQVFTSDRAGTVTQAIAIRGGRIVYVGSDDGVKAYIGPETTKVDLKGRTLLPGLIDAHMHPLGAGSQLLKCSLNYESLTVVEFQKRVQTCVDQAPPGGPDDWLEIVGWFQESMRPSGVKTSRATLDALKTTRPILVRSTFGHTVLANTRALALAKMTKATPDPIGGKIWRDASGEPTGLLEDSAFTVFDSLVPKPTVEQDVQAASAALKAMNQQGVTSFLDAWARPDAMTAFSILRKTGRLTARAHFAPPIEPEENKEISAAVDRIVSFRKSFDEGPIGTEPGITIRNCKLFLDGVISAPAFTGAMLEPYRRNAGTAQHPRWVAGTSRGPDVYFSPRDLSKILIELGRAGIDPHLHADGDGAVRAALDAIESLRKTLPDSDIRPAIAHDEIVALEDFPRFKALDVTAVLSFQWGKPAGDTLGVTDYFGPQRMKLLEPYGRLAQAGARISYGSDWPVDALDEWFALKVGVTRTNSPDVPDEYRGRLGDDPGLSRDQVLRAITINAAYQLHQDDQIGSLEVGKLADLIVLDRNFTKIPAEEIARIKVVETVVGGKVVYANEH